MVTSRSYRGPSGPRLQLGGTVQLAAGLVILSILTGALGLYWLLLCPGSVLSGAVWQPITFGFIETSPLSVVFGALVLVTCGGALETWWGRSRTLRFLVGVTVASGLATILIGLVVPAVRVSYFAGGGAMASAAWCAYGWSLGRTLTNFWGVTVTGDQLAGIGLGLVVLDGALGSMIHVLPDALAVAMTYAYVRRRKR